MKTRQNNLGFSAAECLMIIIILAVIGFIGYNIAMNTIYKDQLTTKLNNPVVIDPTKALVQTAPEIEDLNALRQVDSMFDHWSLSDNTTDISELDSKLSEF